MYQIGDRVLYGIHGVCDVIDKELQMVDKKSVTYLVLTPVGKDGSRYLVPSHNAAAMGKIHRILSPAELMSFLQSEVVHAEHWIQDEAKRKQTYRELITSGDREKLMGMVHSLYLHKNTQASLGRKCHISDENFLKDAEKILTGEISVVMDMDLMEAKKLLKEKLA